MIWLELKPSADYDPWLNITSARAEISRQLFYFVNIKVLNKLINKIFITINTLENIWKIITFNNY